MTHLMHEPIKQFGKPSQYGIDPLWSKRAFPNCRNGFLLKELFPELPEVIFPAPPRRRYRQYPQGR